MENLEFAHGGELWGASVRARRNIAADEVAFVVPKGLILTPQAALEDGSVAAVAAEVPLAGAETAFAAMLLALRLCRADLRREDRFHTYARSLPRSAPGALAWPAQFLDAVKGVTPLISVYEAELDRWEHLIAAAAKDASVSQPPGVFSRPHLKWAQGMVLSRMFPIGLASAGTSTPCMVPLLDLLNHKRGGKAAMRLTERGLEFCPGERVEKGYDIWNNYGDKDNTELLVCHGFTYQTNERNTVILTLPFAPRGPMAMQSPGDMARPPLATYTFTTSGIPEEVTKAIEEDGVGDVRFEALIKALLLRRKLLKTVQHDFLKSTSQLRGALASARRKSINHFLQGQVDVLDQCIEQAKEAIDDSQQLAVLCGAVAQMDRQAKG